MTAEVAILNKTAVALAADSAVTVGEYKIYNSALKIFSLSKVHPVAVMIYGNATLMGVPWEVLIKHCRSKLGKESFASIEQYLEYFLAFIRSKEIQQKYFGDSIQRTWVTHNATEYFELIKQELQVKISNKYFSGELVTGSETESLLAEIVQRHHKMIMGVEAIAGMNAAYERGFEKKYSDQIKDAIRMTFENLPINRGDTKLLMKIGSLLNSRDMFADDYSGIVIAGFGQDDSYPIVITHKIESIIDKHLKIKYLDGKSSGRDGSAHIIPFAQEDMVENFMCGLNPDMGDFIVSYIASMLENQTDLLIDTFFKGNKSDPNSKKLSTVNRTLITNFMNHLNQSRQQAVDAVMMMVEVLPKDELAAMAESLVNLTAFRRRITHTRETVGGPIDVAVISKGDGLVWVSRKHYFDPKLNQHFFKNYFREVDGNE